MAVNVGSNSNSKLLRNSQAEPPLFLEDGWNIIYNRGILKLQSILKHGLTQCFPNDEYVLLYSYHHLFYFFELLHMPID